MTLFSPQHYPAMDGKPPQCFFYDTCGREVINDLTININNTSSHFSSSWYLLRWSTMSDCDKFFKIVITVGVRGPSRVCDEQRELSRNSGIFIQTIFLGIQVLVSKLCYTLLLVCASAPERKLCLLQIMQKANWMQKCKKKWSAQFALLENCDLSKKVQQEVWRVPTNPLDQCHVAFMCFMD